MNKFYYGSFNLSVDNSDKIFTNGKLLCGCNQVYVNKEIPAGWRTGGGDF